MELSSVTYYTRKSHRREVTKTSKDYEAMQASSEEGLELTEAVKELGTPDFMHNNYAIGGVKLTRVNNKQQRETKLVANVIPKPTIAMVRRKSGMRILLERSVLFSFLSGSSDIDTLANNIPTADIVSKIPTVALSNKSCSLTTNGTLTHTTQQIQFLLFKRVVKFLPTKA